MESPGEALHYKYASYDRTTHLKMHPKRVTDLHEYGPLSTGINSQFYPYNGENIEAETLNKWTIDTVR